MELDQQLADKERKTETEAAQKLADRKRETLTAARDRLEKLLHQKQQRLRRDRPNLTVYDHPGVKEVWKQLEEVEDALLDLERKALEDVLGKK